MLFSIKLQTEKNMESNKKTNYFNSHAHAVGFTEHCVEMVGRVEGHSHCWGHVKFYFYLKPFTRELRVQFETSEIKK